MGLTQRLSESDPQVWPILEAEIVRQQTTLELIASENHVSGAVMEALEY